MIPNANTGDSPEMPLSSVSTEQENAWVAVAMCL